MVRQARSPVYLPIRSRSIRAIWAGEGKFLPSSQADASGTLPSCLSTIPGFAPNTAEM